MHIALKPLAFAAAVAAAVPAATLAQDYTWDMPNAFGRNSSDGVADLLFAQLVEEKTDGRIKIVHHFDGSLGYRGSDHLNAVQDGAVPIARHANSYYGGFDPMFLLSTLPFLINDLSEVETLYKVSQPYIEDTFAEYDQVVVSTGLFPPSGIWADVPVRSLEDIQGKKIRAFDLNSLQTFTGAGAAAVNLNWGDVVPALSTGAIEGVVTSADLGVASSIYEYLPNFTEINWAVPLSSISINKDVWDGLPEDLQEAILEAGEETRVATFARLQEQVAQNYEDLLAAGGTVVEDPDADLLDALTDSAEPVIADWRERAGDRAEVLDAYLEAVGR